MDITEQPAPEANAGVSKVEHDRLVGAARQEGHAAGKAEGITEGKAQGVAEATARVAAILDHENAMGREQLSRHLAFKTSMSADDAAAALAAAPKEQAATQTLADRMKNAPRTDTSVPPAPGAEAHMDARERGRQLALAAKGKKVA